MRPGLYELAPELDQGLALIAFERLNLNDSGCAAAAATPSSIPSGCWIKVSDADAEVFPIDTGKHYVFRVLAASPEDMPTLPITGGMSTAVFVFAGVLLGALTLSIYVIRSRRKA